MIGVRLGYKRRCLCPVQPCVTHDPSGDPVLDVVRGFLGPLETAARNARLARIRRARALDAHERRKALLCARAPAKWCEK